MVGGTDEDVHEAIAAAGGPDTRSLEFRVTVDVEATLRQDVRRIRSSPYLRDLEAGGFLYDVRNGTVAPVY
jgi:carbonic anhydrase